ncbi:hypothetical protein BAMA_18450 [Bacillus manliponensis]|uniref:Uncharacterized protein n=1 Tax=Bacillus manliponensis TaxID=574376 RepID=A0A073JS86_9BACI|nr:hypothetical protein [Bacillus manliponensis]KEK17122.1 hypothetical protein BAMA_18450 [Bacillus manliponensis]
MKRLKDDSFTEEMQIPLEDTGSFHEDLANIAGKVINKEEFNHTSEENKRIYQNLFGTLMDMIKG